ncbi:HAD family hydrolase [Patescibacteria group bacterium]|nr:HAD family hydrolase [Patescibacteria group bacterium]
MKKGIIFDWSGVITQNLESIYCLAMTVLAQFGVDKISLAEFRREWEQPYMLFYNKYVPDLTIGEEKKAFAQALKKCPRSQPYPGMNEFLRKLKKTGADLLILSSELPDYIPEEMEALQIENVFSKIYFDVHDKEKVIRSIVAERELDPNKSYFIGDTTHEIEAGRAAGLKTIGTLWGIHSREKLETVKPDFIAADLVELEKYLLER